MSGPERMQQQQSRSGFELARLWAEAPALMPHGAGCACAGHVALHVDASAAEADILDYLAGRYEGLEERELEAFVAGRRTARGTTFSTWLIGIDTAELSLAARARLLADLDATISSLASAAGRG